MNYSKIAKAIAVFPAPKIEKGDATTRAARAIVQREAFEREAKNDRLRKLRLAREAEQEAPAIEDVKPKKSAKRRGGK